MSQTKALFVLAGSVLSLAVPAMADDGAMSRDEVRALVAEMMSDSQSRTSLLQGGGTAGHDDKGFFMASGDGKFRLGVDGYIQNTYYLNFRDDGDAANPNLNEFEPGFQIKRARIEFKGNVVMPELKYFVSFDFGNVTSDSDSGVGILKDAWWDYSFGNNWYVKGGQFKLQFMREENIADTYQLASERSVVNAVFTQDRSQGVEFGYRSEDWRVSAAFSDGFNSDNTPFSTAVGGANNELSVLPEADWAATLRAEWNFMGSLDTLKDFTSRPDGEWAAMVGAAVHYQQSANARGEAPPSGTGGTVYNDLNYLSYTLDVQVEGAGFNAFAAFVGSHSEGRPNINGTGDNDEADDYGVVVQAGYRFGDWEPFLRYEGLFLDNDADTGRVFNTTGDTDDNLNFLTGGVNYYWAGHAAKFTADAVWCFEANNFGTGAGLPVGVGNFVGNNTGILSDAFDNQIVLRFQMQLMF
jgi:hypothetical protein